MKAVYRTDRGKVRAHNEDRVGVFFNNDGDCLAVVADGMGGHKAGDVASEMTLLKFKQLWELTSEITTPESAEQWLADIIAKINNQVYEHANSNEECEGMGTTVVAAIITKSFATIANIGDSRCYILNDQGFNQLTEDHSLVNELVRSGEISKEAAEHHPRKNVLLRALGTEEKAVPDIKTISFEREDLLLLCSDGLSNKITDTEIIEILTQPSSLGDQAEQLVKRANDKGGEDNITLVIVKNDEEKSGDKLC